MQLFCLILLLNSLGVCLLSENTLNGRHLNIAYYHLPPNVIVRRYPLTGEKSSVHGVSLEVLNWLAGHNNFAYSLEEYSEVSGILSNGSWNGIVGAVARKEVDFSLVPQVVSHARSQVVDFTFPLVKETSLLVRPAYREASTLYVLFKPFSTSVWAAFLVVLILAALVLRLLSSFYYYHLMKRRQVKSAAALVNSDFLLMLSVTTGQGVTGTHQWFTRLLSVRCLLTSFALGALVLTNIYSSNLFSMLMIREAAPLPRTVEESLRMGIVPIVQNNSVGLEYYMNAKGGYLKEIGDVLRKHPEYIVANTQAAFNLVAQTGCCSYNILASVTYEMLRRDFEQTGKCRISFGAAAESWGFLAYFVSKDSPYLKRINLEILKLQQTGLPIHWYRTYTEEPYQCLNAWRERGAKRKLNLLDVTSVFVVYFVGIVFGGVAFLLEIIWKYRH